MSDLKMLHHATHHKNRSTMVVIHKAFCKQPAASVVMPNSEVDDVRVLGRRGVIFAHRVGRALQAQRRHSDHRVESNLRRQTSVSSKINRNLFVSL